MLPDKPMTGIAMTLGFCIVAPVGDAIAKLLGSSVPLGQVVFIRFAVQLLILLPLVLLTGRPLAMRGRTLWLAFVRTVLHVIGIAMMFTALKYLPLADAVAIIFVMPFFMLLLGKYVLGKRSAPAGFSPVSLAFAAHCWWCNPALPRWAGPHCSPSA